MVINQTWVELSIGVSPGNSNMVNMGRFSGQGRGSKPGLTYDYPDYVFTGVDSMLTNQTKNRPRLSRGLRLRSGLGLRGIVFLMATDQKQQNCGYLQRLLLQVASDQRSIPLALRYAFG